MFTQFFFNRMSPERKLEYLRKKGTFIGDRIKKSKLVSIYMVSDAFVEVTFDTESTSGIPEQIQMFTSLERLNGYLEEDAKMSVNLQTDNSAAI